MAQQYPVVTITGPRQAGKTTLAQMAFPDKPYVNLERPDIRRSAILDANQFLSRLPDGAVIDEIQRVPELLSYIQVIVDENKQNGQFILTGSHQPELSNQISQSLAGRTALLTLWPLSIDELGGYVAIDELLLTGMLPRIHAEGMNATKAYRNYFQTYVERDVRQLINIKDLGSFEKFVHLIAGRIGQLFKASALANEVGVSYHTIQNWVSVLEASFLLIRLYPYHENFNKRVIKSPKLYFTEVGLATYLLGIEDKRQLSRDPLRGQLFENFVVVELMKQRLNRGLNPHLYFFRDQSGNEIDVLYQRSNELVPIEIKSAMTFHVNHLRTLELFKKWVGSRMQRGYLLYAGDQEHGIQNVDVMPFRKMARIFQEADNESTP